MLAGRSLLLPIIALLSACNMVISETPMFAENDRADVAPKDGVWLANQEDCDFDASQPEAKWPECAVWVVVRNSTRELLVNDGKDQSQRINYLIASGTPSIIQGKWVDEAKEPGAIYYSFYGLEWRQLGPNGFAGASVWPVQCGLQDRPGSDIRPFSGISAECRPSSRDAIRSAATVSRATGEVASWRWLRSEGQ